MLTESPCLMSRPRRRQRQQGCNVKMKFPTSISGRATTCDASKACEPPTPPHDSIMTSRFGKPEPEVALYTSNPLATQNPCFTKSARAYRVPENSAYRHAGVRGVLDVLLDPEVSERLPCVEPIVHPAAAPACRGQQRNVTSRVHIRCWPV